MPELQRAELIEGVVFLAPLSDFHHSPPNFDLISWLGHYRAYTPGVRGGVAGSVRMDWKNMPQPDGLLFILPSHGGQIKKSPDDYIEGAPELAAEIAATSASYDLHVKKEVYRRNGVREYLVWRKLDGEFDWFWLKSGQYERLLPDAEGILKSQVFPGLWLDPPALLKADLQRVIQVLEKGLASPEHQAFLKHLAQTASIS